MNLTIRNMDENTAREILSWRYEKPYDFYNNQENEEEIKERLNGSYRAVIDNNGDVFGFLCTGETAQIPVGHHYGVYHEHLIDIGLGMDPDYVGKGYGYGFCTFILNYIRENHTGTPIRLSVATFNGRAIHLYEKLGFVQKDKFTTDFAEFITMIKD
ncbi:GNAT family N-acetyltransferase [Halobacillus naozhouensis]|uniref:GNAT family N-acetyltransferase n=1 Tax=Halobacillus naozhouensis TaxID=554880 RepID=A0ABY8J438_9BACI|nr:GNAT family N-acetyltransferase [Halobacillus naozhouensis]WFT76377.1 GNAT family N-acetyltransferase [Halobacillus naozhouensis]